MTTKITEKNISSIANMSVQWQSVHVADGSTALTATAGKGYFIDTTSGAQTVNIPSLDDSTLGDTIMLKDFARQWGTNNVTMGSNTFDGDTNTPTFSTAGQTVTLVFMGSTRGWSLINEDTTTGLGALFIAATGGTVATSGNFKIHSFTGDGCFVVSCGGNCAGSNTVDYLVVAGGGGGGSGCQVVNDMEGGGGGAGGLRFSASTYCNPACGAGTALPVTAQTYPVTVGGGAAGSTSPPDNDNVAGGTGSNSVFATITSKGGGGGGSRNTPSGTPVGGQPGGSGGGAGQADNCAQSQYFGAGNTPPVSPPQGNNGGRSAFPVSGASPGSSGGGGGGGAGQVGQNGFCKSKGGNGGNGKVVAITGSCTTYAGGGGGAGNPAGGTGGSGGGGNGGLPSVACGQANTGGGGGGGGSSPSWPGSNNDGGTGGKGIVIIRYKFQ